MKIAIVDYAQSESEKLAKIITSWSKEKGCPVEIFMFSNDQTFLKQYIIGKFELIFINICTGPDEMKAIKYIRQIDTRVQIVILSDSEKYAFEAARFHIFDYIKNPYEHNRISYVLNEIARIFPAVFYRPILKFICGKKKVHLLTSDILYITADNNYTIFTTKNGNKKYRIFFSEVCKLLSDQRFIVCTRGVAVNMEYIQKEEQGIFEMKDGKSFPIHRKGRKEIVETFQKYQLQRLEEKNAYWNIGK